MKSNLPQQQQQESTNDSDSSFGSTIGVRPEDNKTMLLQCHHSIGTGSTRLLLNKKKKKNKGGGSVLLDQSSDFSTSSSVSSRLVQFNLQENCFIPGRSSLNVDHCWYSSSEIRDFHVATRQYIEEIVAIEEAALTPRSTLRALIQRTNANMIMTKALTDDEEETARKKKKKKKSSSSKVENEYHRFTVPARDQHAWRKWVRLLWGLERMLTRQVLLSDRKSFMNRILRLSFCGEDMNQIREASMEASYMDRQWAYYRAQVMAQLIKNSSSSGMSSCSSISSLSTSSL